MDALLWFTLPLALIATPILLSLIVLPGASPVTRLAMLGPLSMGLNVCVPVLHHLAALPIDRPSLAASHAALCVVSAGILALKAWWRHHRARFPTPAATLHQMMVQVRSVGPMLLLYAGVVIPFTHIAGIDTYKWQDLASAVAMETSIPWLVHPVSLLGFTPRSYPSAQPLVLATVQILGNTGVDWGFYIVSLLTGFTAITGAYRLGLRLYEDRSNAAGWLAFLYGFSPLMMRYGYWATGRGFLLALLPLFITLLLDAKRPRSWPGVIAIGVLLALSHKAGLVAVVVIPAALILAWMLARGPFFRVAGVILFAGSISASALLVPSPWAWGVRAVSRFAWLGPLALAGWISTVTSGSPAARRVSIAVLLMAPMSFTDDPYGALLAAPLLAAVAAPGVMSLFGRWPRRRVPVRAGVAILILLAAGVVIVRQAMDSPSRAVYRAARFLESHDPRGPFRLEAPGRERTRMQAYLSGCPRFRVVTRGESRLMFVPPPRLTGHVRADVSAWTRWFRACMDIEMSDVDWYGPSPRLYTVRIGPGGAAADARRIYDAEGIAIFASP